MELLKKFLRQALAVKAQRLSLQVGLPIELVIAIDAEPQQIDDDPITDSILTNLIEFLFASDHAALAPLRQGVATRGALNVPGVGKINLIAQTQARPSLRFYLPPNGQDLFEADWLALSQAQVPPPPRPPKISEVHAPLIPDEPQTLTASTPPRSPQTTGGFIPKMTFDGPLAAAPAINSAQPCTPPSNQALEAKQLFMDKSSYAPIATGPLNAAPAAMTITSGTAAVTPQPIVKANFLSSPNQLISYDFDAGSECSVSVGDNAIDPLLSDMVKIKASDMHLTSGQLLCLRIDGEITRNGSQRLTADYMAKLLDPLFPARNRQEFIDGNDTDFAYELTGVGRFRVNIFRDRNGVGAVLRHIPATILTTQDLNLPAAVTKLCQLSKGLVLVTGPTGSGKSTTLASMLDLINKTRHDHILTIEDPIEFVHPQAKCLVNQREVHRHTQSFARALRAALREDPDIILIGELRDLETVAVAIETAETGHLVFATLHTTTAVSAVDRLIDQFPSTEQEQIRTMLASSLKGVVAQTLLKKKGGGRVAALEILIANDAVSAMIREGKNHMLPGHMQSQKNDGNQLLNEALTKLVKDNIVDVDEAYRKCVDKNGFIEGLKRVGLKLPTIFNAPERTPPGTNKHSA